jgi:fructose-bisphosphate aldolase class 1
VINELAQGYHGDFASEILTFWLHLKLSLSFLRSLQNQRVKIQQPKTKEVNTGNKLKIQICTKQQEFNNLVRVPG